MAKTLKKMNLFFKTMLQAKKKLPLKNKGSFLYSLRSSYACKEELTVYEINTQFDVATQAFQHVFFGFLFKSTQFTVRENFFNTVWT